jgi:hypothetical protein
MRFRGACKRKRRRAVADMTPQELQTPNSQANLVLHKTLRVHDRSAESEEALLIEIAWHAAGFYNVRDAYWL